MKGRERRIVLFSSFFFGGGGVASPIPHQLYDSVGSTLENSGRPSESFLHSNYSRSSFLHRQHNAVLVCAQLPSPAVIDSPVIIIIIIIIMNVLKVMLNVIRCRGTLQSQWSTLTDSTSRKAEESVNVM